MHFTMSRVFFLFRSQLLVSRAAAATSEKKCIHANYPKELLFSLVLACSLINIVVAMLNRSPDSVSAIIAVEWLVVLAKRYLPLDGMITIDGETRAKSARQ